jgi:amino acid permease
MPYVISKCGVVFAIIVFILTQFSATILLKAKNLSRHSNYATILYHIFQKGRAKVLGLVFTAFGNLGVCIAEIIILKQTIRKMLVDVLPEEDPSLQ